MIVRLSTSPVTRVSPLETNSQVWSPHLVKDNYTNWGSSTSFYQKLEGLTLTYREQFKVLGLELLEERRLRAVLTFAYKLLFGYTAVDTRDYFSLASFLLGIDAFRPKFYWNGVMPCQNIDTVR